MRGVDVIALLVTLYDQPPARSHSWTSGPLFVHWISGNTGGGLLISPSCCSRYSWIEKWTVAAWAAARAPRLIALVVTWIGNDTMPVVVFADVAVAPNAIDIASAGGGAVGASAQRPDVVHALPAGQVGSPAAAFGTHSTSQIASAGLQYDPHGQVLSSKQLCGFETWLL